MITGCPFGDSNAGNAADDMDDLNPDFEEQDLENESSHDVDVELLQRLEDRAQLTETLASEHREVVAADVMALPEAIPMVSAGRTEDAVSKLPTQPMTPMTLSKIFECCGVSFDTCQGSSEILDVLRNLEMLATPMRRFCNHVRAAEGIVSPAQVKSGAKMNEHNFCMHQLAIARQQSLGDAKRCSRAEAWMQVQRKLSPTDSSVPCYSPRSTSVQILAIRKTPDSPLQIALVCMVFRGSLAKKGSKEGLPRAMRVSKSVCTTLPATCAKRLHVRTLTPYTDSGLELKGNFDVFAWQGSLHAK